MSSQQEREEILKKLASISPIIPGKVCLTRKTASGRLYYSLQFWKNGKNITTYLPQDRVSEYQTATENYKKALALFEEFVEQSRDTL